MTGAELLDALRQARTYLELKLDLCPPGVLFESLPGSTIQSIAAIYAHAVVTEDSFVQRQMRSTTPIFASPEWSSRIDFPPNVALDPAWAGGFRPDMSALREYARAVYASTDGYLPSASAASLGRLVPKHLALRENGRAAIERREVPLWFVLMDDVVLHTGEHTGEIAALLAARGLKGSNWG